jgi:hypothetical protein
MLKEQLSQEYPGVMGAFPGVEDVSDADLCLLSEGLHTALLTSLGSDRAYHLERIGESHQCRRNPGEAGRYYRQVLDLEPVAEPTAAQRQAMLTHAPLLMTTPTEYFPLKDLVAIHHPQLPLIAYHLFWEDDYNFPDDYEPCDHEQLWVSYAATGPVTDVCTFFHSRLLRTPEAVVEANAHGGRPRIRVEWGLHGSLVAGWESVRFADGGSPETWLDQNFRGVKAGGRAKDHPIKKRWPASFAGEWSDYLDFSRPVDGQALLRDKGMLLVSRWANATLQQHCLAYNFAVKYDWPFDLVPLGQGRTGA